MPLTRFVFLLWLLGALLLAGLWGTSQVREMWIGYHPKSPHRNTVVGFLAGSLTLDYLEVPGGTGFHWGQRKPDRANPFHEHLAEHPPHLGRFHHEYDQEYDHTLIEVPLWFLLALHTLLFAFLYTLTKRRFRKKPIDT